MTRFALYVWLTTFFSGLANVKTSKPTGSGFSRGILRRVSSRPPFPTSKCNAPRAADWKDHRQD